MAIILAAGKGSRFQSDLPKVLHPIHGKPMVHHVIDTVAQCNIRHTCLVVGYKKELVQSNCKPYDLLYATQTQQLGTGHALQSAVETIKKITPTTCLVLAGDCPLIQASTLKTLIKTHDTTHASATILTATLPDAGAYGRIIRNPINNTITAIKEAVDCSPAERLIQEFNSGIYCFNTKHLIESIHHLSTNNQQSEYYLTDIIELMHRQNHTISGYCIQNPMEVSGANTQSELNDLAQYLVG